MIAMRRMIGKRGRMKLFEFLDKVQISQSEFARKIKSTQPAVSRFIIGERIPRKRLMEAIYRATKGEVQPNDFYDLRLKKIKR